MEDLNLNQIYTCYHCGKQIGSLISLINCQQNHQCFKYYDKIDLDAAAGVARGLNKIIETDKNDSDAGPSCSNTNLENAENIPNQNSETVNETKTNERIDVWTDDEVRLLISTYKEFEEKLSSPQHNKKSVWILISKKLKIYNINRTPTKCDEKWRNLKKKYDSIRRHNQETGNNPKFWKFYEDLHEIFFKDPLFNPVARVSSTGQIKTTAETNQSKYSPLGSIKKRPQSLTYKEVEENRQKRHQQKMEFKREVFSWLKEAFKKDKF